MRISLLLTVDVDHDGISIENERTHLSWNAVRHVPAIQDVHKQFSAPATWFVRADDQLREIYGTSRYLLAEYERLWQGLRAAGDEIAWHPHLYQWNAGSDRFFNDTNPERCAATLRSVYRELLKGGDDRFQSVRIGEAFHGNAMMRMLGDLKLSIDATALPGRRRQDDARVFDWEPTPNEPYYPSRHDYRVPDPGDTLSILEVPFTMLPIQAEHEAQPLSRYANLAYHHAVFRAGIDAHLERVLQSDCSHQFLTTILHPDEIRAEGQRHPLYAFSLAAVEQNLNYLLEALTRCGIDHHFLRMRDVISFFASPMPAGGA